MQKHLTHLCSLQVLWRTNGYLGASVCRTCALEVPWPRRSSTLYNRRGTGHGQEHMVSRWRGRAATESSSSSHGALAPFVTAVHSTDSTAANGCIVWAACWPWEPLLWLARYEILPLRDGLHTYIKSALLLHTEIIFVWDPLPSSSRLRLGLTFVITLAKAFTS